MKANRVLIVLLVISGLFNVYIIGKEVYIDRYRRAGLSFAEANSGIDKDRWKIKYIDRKCILLSSVSGSEEGEFFVSYRNNLRAGLSVGFLKNESGMVNGDARCALLSDDFVARWRHNETNGCYDVRIRYNKRPVLLDPDGRSGLSVDDAKL